MPNTIKIDKNINTFSQNYSWIILFIISVYLTVGGYTKSLENLDLSDVGGGVNDGRQDHNNGYEIAGNEGIINGVYNNNDLTGSEGGGLTGDGIGAGGDIGGGVEGYGNILVGENLTISTPTMLSDNFNIIDNNQLLNNFMNISNSAPELIEYYELDDDIIASMSSSSSSSSSLSLISTTATKTTKTTTINPPPDIYPDPEEFDRKINFHTLNNHRDLFYNRENNNNNNNNDNLFPLSSSTTTNYNKDLEARDNDFKGHDFIDNIMYIYYGSNNKLKNSIGSSIVIGGSVLALAAQILCSILMILRNRSLRRQNALFFVFLNFAIILLLSNLIFIIGVQSTKNEFRCGMVAILLHYSHLCTAVWGLIYIYIIYDYVVNDCGINLKYNYFMAYGVPAVYVLFSCAISSTSYEIIEYCWMSVQRGMIINFMIPVSSIIIASTILGTLCLREIANKQREVIAESIENILDNAAKCHEINTDAVIETDNRCCEWDDRITDEYIIKNKNDFYDSKFDLGVLSIVDLSLQSSTNDSQDFSDFKHSIKFLLFFQPAFAVCWFFGVIALENRESCVMPIVFIISYNIMNWYFLIRSPYICPIIQDQHQTDKSHQINDNNGNIDEINNHNNSSSLCTDTIPLLCTPTSLQHNQKSVIVEDCMNEVQLNISTWTDSIGDISCNMDSISTISS